MSTADGGPVEHTCPACQSRGQWHGDLSRGALILDCASDDCQHTWTAPSLAGVGGGR